MTCAREMGMTEDEFWKSDPVFFNECLEKFYERKKKMIESIFDNK